MYFFSEIVYLCEYQEGGLTDQIYKIRKKSPNATLLYYYEFSNNKINFIYRMRGYLNFWRFFYISNKKTISQEIKFPKGFFLVLYLD